MNIWQRQGSGAVYLNIFHSDIEDFLETKKILADEDFRVKTLSIGVTIPDKFIELAKEDQYAYLFYPHTVYKATGEKFNTINITERYDELVNNPAIRKRKVKARKLLEQIAILRSESGYPYLFFTDNVNKHHALNHISPVKFSNLCTEVLQASIPSEYTNYGQPDKIGLDINCILGSVNIKNVMETKKIEDTIYQAVDILTWVSDHTHIENAPGVKKANELMRSIGIGAMNLHGYLVSQGIPYESEEAKEFCTVFFAAMNYYSLVQSNKIAKERKNPFYGFAGSTYADGSYFNQYTTMSYLPVNKKVQSLFDGMTLPTKDDWNRLKKEVQEHGLYHAYRLAIAPNGSISYVQSATASVMPIMEKIEERTYGNSKTYYPMPGLSPSTWFLYKEAYDMDMKKVIDLIATIQPHIDQGISFTLFLKDTMTTRESTHIDLYAHHKGIKTVYYARTKDTGSDECLSCQV